MNVKFNQKLWYKNILKEQWIYPNPGDAGLAVGACLHEWFLENSDIQHKKLDSLYTGPEFSNKEIKEFLDDRQINIPQHILSAKTFSYLFLRSLDLL